MMGIRSRIYCGGCIVREIKKRNVRVGGSFVGFNIIVTDSFIVVACWDEIVWIKDETSYIEKCVLL